MGMTLAQREGTAHDNARNFAKCQRTSDAFDCGDHLGIVSLDGAINFCEMPARPSTHHGRWQAPLHELREAASKPPLTCGQFCSELGCPIGSGSLILGASVHPRAPKRLRPTAVGWCLPSVMYAYEYSPAHVRGFSLGRLCWRPLLYSESAGPRNLSSLSELEDLEVCHDPAGNW